MFWPAVWVVGLADFCIVRSAEGAGLTITVSGSAWLPGIGSGVVELTEAVFVIEPVGVPVARTTTWKLAVPPFASGVFWAQVTVPAAKVQPAPAETKLRPAGRGSTAVRSAAAV